MGLRILIIAALFFFIVALVPLLAPHCQEGAPGLILGNMLLAGCRP